ncbi:MAG: hypothetical protein JST11_04080 [Acidobacteria bacterium]|nr:hypothetical protein [Acidobacteriota bacterium]
MSPERLRRIEVVFHGACDRPVAEREAFLQRTGNWDLTLYIAAVLNLAGVLLWLRVDAGRGLEQVSHAS